jgi:hypothetical protein
MKMLLAIGAVLVVLRLLALLFFKVVGFAIHLLLIAGLILLVVGFVRRGPAAVRRRVQAGRGTGEIYAPRSRAHPAAKWLSHLLTTG